MSLSPAYRLDQAHKIHDTTRNFASFATYKTKPTSLHIQGQEHSKVPNILNVQKMPYLQQADFPYKMKTLADDIEVKRLLAEAQQDKKKKKEVEEQLQKGDLTNLPDYNKSPLVTEPSIQRSPMKKQKGKDQQVQLIVPAIVQPQTAFSPQSNTMGQTGLSSTQQWRNRVICQTENRKRKNGSKSPNNSPSPNNTGNEIFRGSLNPKDWRQTGDTEELGALLQPHQYPHGRVFMISPNERFKTHNAREFQNKSINKVPMFSNNDACRLRRTIDTNSPAHIHKDPVYNDIYARLYKQINVNKRESVKKAEFERTRNEFIMTSTGRKPMLHSLIQTPEGGSPNVSPKGSSKFNQTFTQNITSPQPNHRQHLMQTTNARFFKSPSPDAYRKEIPKPHTVEGLAAVAHAAQGSACPADIAHTSVYFNMHDSINALSQNNTPEKEKEKVDKQKRQAKYAQMQKDRLKSHYGGMFNSRDRSQDIAIDEILRSTLQKPFESDNWLKMQDDLLMDSTAEANNSIHQGNESPRLPQTQQATAVQKEHQAATQKLRKKCQMTHGNFHQTHLDTYPFRNGLKKVSQKRKESVPRNKQIFLKQLEQGQQQISYWAGLRIQGPITKHELKESYQNKLQASWYKDNFFGPMH